MTIIKSTVNNAFALTFTQCKQLKENGVDIRDLLERLNTQPAWLDNLGSIESISEIQAILQGGCESGAYMPAVEYHTAQKAMGEYGDEILEGAQENGQEFSIISGAWSNFCTKVCSAAVEQWCSQFADNLDSVNWD